jgi:hypothetical protein
VVWWVVCAVGGAREAGSGDRRRIFALPSGADATIANRPHAWPWDAAVIGLLPKIRCEFNSNILLWLVADAPTLGGALRVIPTLRCLRCATIKI